MLEVACVPLIATSLCAVTIDDAGKEYRTRSSVLDQDRYVPIRAGELARDHWVVSYTPIMVAPDPPGCLTETDIEPLLEIR